MMVSDFFAIASDFMQEDIWAIMTPKIFIPKTVVGGVRSARWMTSTAEFRIIATFVFIRKLRMRSQVHL
jgi:hypothetical protein